MSGNTNVQDGHRHAGLRIDAEMFNKLTDEEMDLIKEHYPEALKHYLIDSDYRVPPLPDELNEHGEPSIEHLLRHGGALKPSRVKNRMPEKIDFSNLHLSFGGCGFLGMYHLGVINAITHFVPNCNITKVCGTSAGAIAAAALVGEVSFRKSFK